MLAWIGENIATIGICLVLALIVAGIVCKLVADKRKGKSSCGCNCAQCAMAGACHDRDPKKSGSVRKRSS